MKITKLLIGVAALQMAVVPAIANAAPLSTVGSPNARVSAPVGETSEFNGKSLPIALLILLLLGTGAGIALSGGGDDDEDTPPVSF